jgi:phage-related protein
LHLRTINKTQLLKLDLIYKILYKLPIKDVEFLGSSLEDLRTFPISARRAMGFQIDLVQQGIEPEDWKPMTAVGAGVREIRARDATGAYRAIYLAKLADAVYVLHCFQKKTQQTAKADIELARKRLTELMSNQGAAKAKPRRVK